MAYIYIYIIAFDKQKESTKNIKFIQVYWGLIEVYSGPLTWKNLQFHVHCSSDLLDSGFIYKQMETTSLKSCILYFYRLLHPKYIVMNNYLAG